MRYHHHLNVTMGFPILVRQHIYIEFRCSCYLEHFRENLVCCDVAIFEHFRENRECCDVATGLFLGMGQYAWSVQELTKTDSLSACIICTVSSDLVSLQSSSVLLLGKLTSLTYRALNVVTSKRISEGMLQGAMFSLFPFAQPFNCKQTGILFFLMSFFLMLSPIHYAIICSDNGLLPGRRQAIIWTNTAILLIRTSGTNFNETNSYISIQENTFENGGHFVSASVC